MKKNNSESNNEDIIDIDENDTINEEDESLLNEKKENYGSNSYLIQQGLFTDKTSFGFVKGNLSEGQTCVYIWYSSRKGGDGVGHISIGFAHEGKDFYISFWPKLSEGEERSKEKLLEIRAFSAMECKWHSRIEDRNVEGREPDYTFSSNRLDIGKMYEMYEVLKKNKKTWKLTGSSPLETSGSASNCIGIAIQILEAGGISQLAGESIVKIKRNYLDSGIFPYRQNSLEKIVKGFTICGCFLSCTCAIGVGCVLPLGILFLAILSTPIFIAMVMFLTPFLLLIPNFHLGSPFLQFLYNRSPIFTFIRSLPFPKEVWAVVVIFWNLAVMVATYKYLKKGCFGNEVNHEQSREDFLDFGNPRDQVSLYACISLLSLKAVNFGGKVIRKAGECPYDTLRGIIDNTLTPDGEILRLLKKAMANEKKEEIDNKKSSGVCLVS